jgi:hypothetical protein
LFGDATTTRPHLKEQRRPTFLLRQGRRRRKGKEAGKQPFMREARQGHGQFVIIMMIKAVLTRKEEISQTNSPPGKHKG